MKKIKDMTKKIILKYGGAIASCAFAFVVIAANYSCGVPFYEPEELVGKTLIAIVNLPPRAMMGIDSCGMLLSAIHEEEGEEKLHLLMVDNHIPAGAKLY